MTLWVVCELMTMNIQDKAVFLGKRVRRGGCSVSLTRPPTRPAAQANPHVTWCYHYTSQKSGPDSRKRHLYAHPKHGVCKPFCVHYLQRGSYPKGSQQRFKAGPDSRGSRFFSGRFTTQNAVLESTR